MSSDGVRIQVSPAFRIYIAFHPDLAIVNGCTNAPRLIGALPLLLGHTATIRTLVVLSPVSGDCHLSGGVEQRGIDFGWVNLELIIKSCQ